MPSKRLVLEQQLSDAGEDLVRLAAAKDAEIASLTEQRDRWKADCEDITTCLTSERQKFMELLKGLTEQRDRAMKDAVIAWSVCASIHREFCNGRDPIYTTRQADFVKHETDARAALDADAAAETAPSLPETPEMVHCCEPMRFNVESSCDTHPDRFDCADCLIHQRADGQYGIMIHDGGSSVALMQFCPWCGTKLPARSAYPSLPETPEAT